MADKKSSTFPSLSSILEKAFEDAPEYFVVVDCNLQVQMAGSSFREATGFEPGSSKSFLDTVERFSASRVRESLEALGREGSGRSSMEVRHQRADGTLVTVAYSWVACLDDSGTCRALVGLGREEKPAPKSKEDLEELRRELEEANLKMERRAKEIARLRQEIQKQTTRDDMTELGNRKFLLERLETEVARAGRYEQPLTLILFDVDRMSQINETYGRDKGDEVIREIARVVREQIRNTDIAGRYDGEEFMVLCPHTDRTNAQFLAERLRRRVAELSFQTGREEFGATVSVGLVTLGGHNEFDAEAIVQAAETALATAKQGGMNRVRVFEVL